MRYAPRTRDTKCKRRSCPSFPTWRSALPGPTSIVCRAGAITAAEIAAAGRAAIFIPFGEATDSHQLRNAQEMVSARARARLIPEPELTAERLTNEIFSLLDQPGQMEKLAANARSLAHPNAVRDIVNLIEEAERRPSRKESRGT